MWPPFATAGIEEGAAAYERGDYHAAFLEFMPLARAGDPVAQYFTGAMYDLGKGLPEDDAEAARWYRRAADQGDADAQRNLCAMYAKGEGVPHNYTQAVRWCRLAAQQGDALAQYNLGVAYDSGEGVPQDNAEAVRWYRSAADQGLAQAQFNLGAMHYLGEGVPQDDARAVYWYRLAAEQGYTRAQFSLGLMYYLGSGVPKNDGEAVHWYRLAAEQEYAKAQLNLGQMYYLGEYVPQDDVAAYMWLNLAAASLPHGEEMHEEAVELRDKVGARLSPAQRTQAQELARNWQPRVAARSEGESPDRWWEEFPPVAGQHPDAPLQRRLEGTGTGFAVSERGHLLTNHHVVAGCAAVRVQPPLTAARDEWSDVLDFGDEQAPRGEAAAAVVVARDPSNDLALLEAPVRLPPPIALDDRGIRAGDTVVAVGFPLPGLLASEASVTTGTVSALAGIGNDMRLLQVTVPVQPGNSGGPLVDLHGRVVGVVVGKLDALEVASLTGDIPQNVNFAIKAGVAQSFLAANGIAYQSDVIASGPEPSMELSPATVGAQAKAFTVLLECWK
jgi:TPR repeat protein